MRLGRTGKSQRSITFSELARFAVCERQAWLDVQYGKSMSAKRLEAARQGIESHERIAKSLRRTRAIQTAVTWGSVVLAIWLLVLFRKLL